MVLVVLTVFVMGTVARWRVVRQRRREEPAPAPAPTAQETPVQETRVQDVPVHEVPTPRTPQQAPPTTPATPAPLATSQQADPSAPAANGKRVGGWETHRVEGAVHYGPRDSRHETATAALRDAEAAALVITSNPALWSETKDASAKLGPTHLYDPNHLCDTPARFHWSPTAGCEDRETATARAAALLTPVRPTARLDQAVGDTAGLVAAQLPPRRRHRRPHRTPRAPLVTGAPGPGRRPHPAHPSQGRPGSAGVRRSSPPGAPGHRRPLSPPGPGRTLHGQYPRGVHSNRSDALAWVCLTVHERGRALRGG
ncbi:Type VI secretion protein OS=Streptomyces tendae OX=1932 GN=GUR47_25555 PE=4 SV=1 [Streptomyces tendae]